MSVLAKSAGASVWSAVRLFLGAHAHGDAPLCLGLSGGSDSLALFYALVELGDRPIHVVHIDHGWREESAREADALLRLVSKEGLVTPHFFRLEKPPFKANSEDWARARRHEIFQKVCRKVGAHAVLLAHHADDQAETILKRVCEGASLPRCAGLRPTHEMRSGLVIWRPVLALTKSQLQEYLRQLGVEPLEDRTNDDQRFLRARLRRHGLPALEAAFQRNVCKGLMAIGSSAAELADYLEAESRPYLKELCRARCGFYLDFGVKPPAHPFLIKYLIRKLCDDMGATLSKAEAAEACRLIIEGAPNRRIRHDLHIDRGRLFWYSPSGHWKLSVTEGLAPNATGWQAAFAGRLSVSLPRGTYRLGPPDLRAPFGGCRSLARWLTNHKVPSFLRSRIPVLWRGEQMVHEFLTGKVLPVETLPAVSISAALDGSAPALGT